MISTSNSLLLLPSDRDESNDISLCRKLLWKMTSNWPSRSQSACVRESIALEFKPEMAFDKDKDDFRADLLPFKAHPDFLCAPLEFQKKALSCGWLAYNDKTIDIESKVVSPACSHIIYKEVPGIEDSTSQLLASETLVDEAYHIQLVVKVCRLTRFHRQMEGLRATGFSLAKEMEREKAIHAEPWKKVLVQMAAAIVSEVFISDYLTLLAYDSEIQPLNRLTVHTHLKDEKAHHGIFIGLAKCMYAHLDSEQQEFFADMLPKPVRWFASLEFDVWILMLHQIGFPNADKIVQDCRSEASINLARIDYSGIISLAEELGVLDSQRGIDSFGKAELIS